jgi:hypothetical protein
VKNLCAALIANVLFALPLAGFVAEGGDVGMQGMGKK